MLSIITSSGSVALPFSIYNDDTLIGFVMFGYGVLEGDDCEPDNVRAKTLYNSFGFKENGEYCESEVVAVLKL